MNSLFGVEMGTLALVLVVLVAAVALLVAVLALHNRVLVRMALRNIPRRRGRSALIVLGLMLGTLIVSAALGTGDTMSHTIRVTSLAFAGDIDEVISTEGSSGGFVGIVAGNPAYFDEARVDDVEAVLDGAPVDGIAPIIREDVAVRSDSTRQNEPRVVLFAAPPERMAGFGQIRESGGGIVELAALGPGEVYINGDLAGELGVAEGASIDVFAGGGSVAMRVAAVVSYDGALAAKGDPALLLPLAEAQRILGREGQVRHIIVSNEGGVLTGVAHTGEVIGTLDASLPAFGLEAEPFKRDVLDFADEAGAGFTAIFATFGTFSIIAGMMLIFLIFVMLAAERKAEMGIARAIGTQRRHLVQMFVFEGAAYGVFAAAVGSALGIAVAYGMTLIAASAFAEFDLDIEHTFRWRSLVVAATLGSLLTFAVVAFSAWRVSTLNIVTAVRNLPESVAPSRGGRFWIAGVLVTLLGALLLVTGRQGDAGTPYHLGVSLIIIGPLAIMRRLGVPDRMAYTLPGVLLVFWWLFPWESDFLAPDELSGDLGLFLLSGIMTVTGACWVVMYNADLLLAAIVAVFGRSARFAPAVRVAVTYPMRERFRTGLTVAMFSLIVFTLVVVATVNSAFTELFDDDEAFGGGYRVLASSVVANPIDDIGARIAASDNVRAADVTAIGSQSVLAADARQVGTGAEFEQYAVRGLDDAFLRDSTYELALVAEGYGSRDAVWQAIAENPGLAVIDSFPVPRRDNFGFVIGGTEFKLEGFYMEDETFAPVPVEVLDAATGETHTLTVIGVLKDTAPQFMFGLSTSQETAAAAFGDRAVPALHFLRVAEGVDPEVVANGLEAEFFENGVEAESLPDELDDLVRSNMTLNYIIEGFMALGLMVGVTALGVISARSVAERRQQIGVMRAIGFGRGTVQLTFLVESSFVALLGIAIGASLGLVVVYQLLDDMARSPATAGIPFAVPWMNLAIVFGGAYVASFLATLVPAYWASRVYPAEALRYE